MYTIVQQQNNNRIYTTTLSCKEIKTLSLILNAKKSLRLDFVYERISSDKIDTSTIRTW